MRTSDSNCPIVLESHYDDLILVWVWLSANLLSMRPDEICPVDLKCLEIVSWDVGLASINLTYG